MTIDLSSFEHRDGSYSMLGDGQEIRHKVTKDSSQVTKCHNLVTPSLWGSLRRCAGVVSRSGRWWSSPRRVRWALGEEHPAARVDWAAGRRARELAVLGRRRDVARGPGGLPRALASFGCLRRESRGSWWDRRPRRLRCAGFDVPASIRFFAFCSVSS